MNKKFILFIVEGKNDERELEALLHTPYFSEYLNKYVPQFSQFHGDLTTDKNVTVNNVLKKLNDIVTDFRKNGVPFSNIKVQDIQEIVHIVDLDGAFIPLDCIIRGDGSSFTYEDDCIVTANVDGARGRNKKKAEILKKLIETKQIQNIPYSLYFASCDMDHLLFDRRNSPGPVKSENSRKFQLLCKSNPERLEESVFKPGIAVGKNYPESWSKIQYDCESLQRHTNIHLFFGTGAKYQK